MAGFGGFFSDVFGSTTDKKAGVPDRTDYDYNGRGSSAYAQDAQAAQGRAGANANYYTANQDYQQAQGARVQEQDALDKMRAAANGNVASAAELQQQMGVAQTIAAQQAQAGAARGGPGAWAAAQRGAQISGVNAMQNGVNAAAQLRAQEQERARMGYLQGANQMRGTDLSSRGQSAQQAQFDANLQQQQKAQNDAYSLGLGGLEQGAARADQAGRMGYSGDRIGSENQKAQADAQANQKNAMFGAGLASSALTGMSDERQKFGIQPVGINAQANDLQAQMGAMYGSPVAVQPTLDRDAGMMGQANQMQATLDATYGAPVAAGTQAALNRDAGIAPYAFGARLTPEDTRAMGQSLANIDTSKVAAGTQSALDRDAKALADKKAKADAKAGGAGKGGEKDEFTRGQELGQGIGTAVSALSDEKQKTGATNVGAYDTKLSPEEEAQFQAWRSKAVRPEDKGEDYDFRGAWKAGIAADPKNAHWPDTFKKPNHATFSDESQYAKGENYQKAGHWNGETFTPAKQQLAKDAAMMAQAKELEAQMGAMYSSPPAVQQSAPAQMLEQLEPYAYHYKPESGEDPLKQRYGIMAQDLEKSPMGASLTVDTARGKEVDIPAATTASLAALADVHKRLKAVESRKGR